MVAKCIECGSKAVKQSRCRDCYNAWFRAYRKRRPEAFKEYDRKDWARKNATPEGRAHQRARTRDYMRRLRHDAIMAYGGYRCACCGETEPKFLSIDHMFNDGAKHRREIGEYPGNGKGCGTTTMQWLKKHGYPAGFQVLCMNCNMGKSRNNGVCPHKSRHLMDNCLKSGNAQTG